MSNSSPLQGILSGMRLVEASAFVAAPLGGMTLAQLGADVIRIDTLGGGLDYRRWPVTKDNVSLFWCGLNKSKRSVALDLSKPQGRELAMAIVTAPGDDAGLFLTNFPPRGWLDFEKLREKRPDFIQLTLQGDRNGGSAVDYTVNASVGFPSITGPALKPGALSHDVVNHVLPAWDLATGHMVAVGLLAAERHRRIKGEGQHVKLALEDVALASLGHLGFIAEQQLGQTRERHGNELFGAFGRDFLTADGQRVMVVGLTGKQWRSICDALQIDPQVQALGDRLHIDLSLEGNRFIARSELAAIIGPWIHARAFSEVRKIFDQHGVCWSRYQTIAELIDSNTSCSLANPMFSTLEQPGVGEYLAPGVPLNFSLSQRMPVGVAPALGQHTEEVLVEILGLSSAEFGRLHDQGLVATPVG